MTNINISLTNLKTKRYDTQTVIKTQKPPADKYTHTYTNLYLPRSSSIVPPVQNKNPIATVTVTKHHLLTFSIISFDRDIFDPNGSCALKASVKQNIIRSV